MSTAGDSDTKPSSSEGAEEAEYQPLQTLPQYASELEEFATSCGLEQKLDMLRKASALLRHEDPSDIPGFTGPEMVTLRREFSNKWQQPKLLYFTIMACSLGAVEQGWAQTSMNGANLYFPEELGVGSKSARDIFIVGFINSAIYLSIALWGSWLSEPINHRFGRRGAIFAGSMLCLVASVGSAISWSWLVLALFRLLLGTGLGINASTVSVFAAECSPATIRGGLAVSWQMWTAFGIFLGFVVNVAVNDYGSNTWRLQLAGPFIPAVVLLLALYICPESPAWYIKKGRYDLAYRSLSRLRNTEVLAAKEVYASYLRRKPIAGPSYLSRVGELFTKPRIRNATVGSFAVMLCQQLCGINVIAFYSSTIFSDAGFSQFNALVASCVFGLVNFLGAFPAVWTMDTLGRRNLLLWTLPFMALTMLAIGLTFKLPEGNLQFGMLATLIYLFCAEYSPGMGPVPCAYSAEVFPLSHREIGMSWAVATASVWAAVLSLTFPGLIAGLGSEGTFELYAMLNVVAFGLVFAFVRETKGKTLEELDAVFAGDVSEFVKLASEQPLSWLRRRVSPHAGGREYSELRQEEIENLD